MSKKLTIGDVSKVTGIATETIRYYENEGLVCPDRDGRSSYRQFSERHVEELYFIKNARNLGFSLKEVGHLARLRVDPRDNCSDIKSLLNERLRQLEMDQRRIEEQYQELKSRLGKCLLSSAENCDQCNLIVDFLEPSS